MTLAMRSPRPILLGTAVGIWALLVGAGIEILWSYSSAPGDFGHPREAWPTASRLRRDPAHPTLVMAAHPRCPCTRASVEELARLMTKLQGKVTAYVLFIRPASLTPEWEKTDLWQSAARIPGVIPVRDDEGREAALFGARTSGHTFLYGAGGTLIFSGGITAARGHSGDSVGQDRILSLVNGGGDEGTRSSVFGCGLFSGEEV